MSIRVLLADDQALVRSGLRVLLDRTPDIEVVDEAADGQQALTQARRHAPDVVLMDIRMPGMDGVQATRAIAADPQLTDVRVIMLTTFDLDEYVFDALHAGASGFLLKDIEPDELRTAIRVVADGQALLSPSITRRLIAAFVSRPDHRPHPPAALEELTARERDVMALVAAGLTNEHIAEQLVITHATVKTHMSRILLKLGARDRTQLVVLAYETGLVNAGSPAQRP
jgi:DNA-binding NarL/FixJ family response regulator